MQELNANWITEGRLDFEYKKYLLLAYLKHVEDAFDEQKLYPFLNDIVVHYKNLWTLKNTKKAVQNSLPKKISKLDFSKFKIEFEDMIDDDQFIAEIENIMDFAIPAFKEQLEGGKGIYQLVEEEIKIEPIGIVPLNQEFGYLFIKNGAEKNLNVFEYSMTIFHDAKDKFRAIKTSPIKTFTKKVSNTYESFKRELIQENKHLPNPATYLIHTQNIFPFQETLFPMAKRSLVQHIAAA